MAELGRVADTHEYGARGPAAGGAGSPAAAPNNARAEVHGARGSTAR